jgi:hypothetical protein
MTRRWNFWFDRDGGPITVQEWEQQVLYADRRVARTLISDAADPTVAFEVSTVFWGMDGMLPYNLALSGDYTPKIWSTALLDHGSVTGEWCYATEAEAREEHRSVVALTCATLIDPVTRERPTSTVVRQPSRFAPPNR